MKRLLAVTAVLVVHLCRAPHAESQAINRVQILELRFPRDSVGSIVLEKGTVYWAELDGRGEVLFRASRDGRPAFIVPVEEGSKPRRFQVYPAESGPHSITLTDQDSGVVVTLRLYRDVAETARTRQERDRGVAIGLSVALGLHTGLGIDSLGGTNPSGGSDWEGCLLLRSGENFAACVGAGSQAFPDAALHVGWIFFEGQVRLLSRQLFSHRNTDFDGTMRFSKATGVDSRNEYPEMLGVGLQFTQHLAEAGRRRGLSLFVSWQHGWLSSAPGSQDERTDIFKGGLIWLP